MRLVGVEVVAAVGGFEGGFKGLRLGICGGGRRHRALHGGGGGGVDHVEDGDDGEAGS